MFAEKAIFTEQPIFTVLVNMKYVYLIRNTVTGQCYIGSSSILPMNRWLEHVGNLRRGAHSSARFQKAFDASNRDLTLWEFKVLETIETRELLRIEAEWIIKIPADLRLNMPGRTTVTREKHLRVIQLLKEGRKGYEIGREVGLSAGMISRIKKLVSGMGLEPTRL